LFDLKIYISVGEFAVAKMAEAEAVDVEKKNEEGEANVEEKSQEDLIKESIAAAVMKWPGRKWARRKDPKKGVMLKLLDDIEKINRGGKMVEIVKHCAFGVPPIIIGHHLDEDGEKGLAKRLASPKWSIEETAWWAINYKPGQQIAVPKGKRPIRRKKAPTPKPEEPKDDGGDGNDGDSNDGDDGGEVEEPEPIKMDVGFDLNDLLNKIPFMYPGKEPCTWRFWIDLVHELLDPLKADGKLDEKQYLDIMQARMGGKHLKDMKRMRAQKKDRPFIEQYFLGLDGLKKAKAAKSRTSRTIELIRNSIKTKWGVKLGYLTSSPTLGLQLVLGEVAVGSPAWNSGLRANDALTVVNDWQLHLFKNGDTAASIFGAVGNQATATVVSPCEGSILECKSVSVY